MSARLHEAWRRHVPGPALGAPLPACGVRIHTLATRRQREPGTGVAGGRWASDARSRRAPRRAGCAARAVGQAWPLAGDAGGGGRPRTRPPGPPRVRLPPLCDARTWPPPSAGSPPGWGVPPWLLPPASAPVACANRTSVCSGARLGCASAGKRVFGPVSHQAGHHRRVERVTGVAACVGAADGTCPLQRAGQQQRPAPRGTAPGSRRRGAYRFRSRG